MVLFALQLSHDVDDQLAIPAEVNFTLEASETGRDIPVSVQIKGFNRVRAI
jgi:hypothetical protein